MSNLFNKKIWNDNDWSIFINNLDILRISSNIKKKEDFSKKIGVSNIYRKNYNHPSELTVMKLCKLFKVNEEWLSEYQTRIPPENSSARPGSTNGTKGIVICGYQFRDRKIAVKCVNLLWYLEQLSSELLNHGQMCLQMLLDGANIMLKKNKNQS